MNNQSSYRTLARRRHVLYGRRCVTVFHDPEAQGYAISHSALNVSGGNDAFMCNRIFGQPKNPMLMTFLIDQQARSDAMADSSNPTELMRAKATTAFQRRLLILYGAAFLNCKAKEHQALEILKWLQQAYAEIDGFEASPNEMCGAFGHFLAKTKCGRALLAAA